MPEVACDKPAKQKFKQYPIWYFHIDIASTQTAKGKLYLYVATDRTSKVAFVQTVKKRGSRYVAQFFGQIEKPEHVPDGTIIRIGYVSYLMILLFCSINQHQNR